MALGPHAHPRLSASVRDGVRSADHRAARRRRRRRADGASYREILDVADWDRSIVTNVPGQSAQPESPFYRNLLPLWADDTYFPLVYSRPRVDREAAHTLRITPVR